MTGLDQTEDARRRLQHLVDGFRRNGLATFEVGLKRLGRPLVQTELAKAGGQLTHLGPGSPGARAGAQADHHVEPGRNRRVDPRAHAQRLGPIQRRPRLAAPAGAQQGLSQDHLHMGFRRRRSGAGIQQHVQRLAGRTEFQQGDAEPQRHPGLQRFDRTKGARRGDESGLVAAAPCLASRAPGRVLAGGGREVTAGEHVTGQAGLECAPIGL